MNRRKQAQQNEENRIDERRKKKLEEKAEHERTMVKKQIKVEQAQRQEIEDERNQEKKMIEQELAGWSQNQHAVQVKEEVIATKVVHSTEVFSEEDITKEVQERVPSKQYTEEDLDLDMEDDCEDGIDMEEIMAKVKKQFVKKEMPPPRQSSSISVQFTDRGPLPSQVARESEDTKWMARIQEMKSQHKKKLLQESQKSNTESNGEASLVDDDDDDNKNGWFFCAL